MNNAEPQITSPQVMARRAKQRTTYTRTFYADESRGHFLAVGSPVVAKEVVYFAIGLYDYDLIGQLRRIRVPEREIADYFASRNNASNAVGRCKKFDSGQIVVRVRDMLGSTKALGTLSHEIGHAVSRLMERYAKQKVFENEEEVRCCLAGFYMEQVLSTIKPVIHTYDNPKLTWDDTCYIQFNFDNHTDKVTDPQPAR